MTTIVDMPYGAGFLVCTGDRLRQKADEAGRQARIDFALYGTVHPNDGPRHIQDIVAAGAAGFKFSTFGTHPERFPRVPPYTLYGCFAEVARSGLIAGVHNENDEFVRASETVVAASGLTDYRAHGLSRPPLSEALATAEVYEIAAATGCPGHIVHCSIGRGYELCAAYRAQGFDTTIEACIHYLILDEENDVARLGGKAKINLIWSCTSSKVSSSRTSGSMLALSPRLLASAGSRSFSRARLITPGPHRWNCAAMPALPPRARSR